MRSALDAPKKGASALSRSPIVAPSVPIHSDIAFPTTFSLVVPSWARRSSVCSAAHDAARSFARFGTWKIPAFRAASLIPEIYICSMWGMSISRRSRFSAGQKPGGSVIFAMCHLETLELEIVIPEHHAAMLGITFFLLFEQVARMTNFLKKLDISFTFTRWFGWP